MVVKFSVQGISRPQLLKVAGFNKYKLQSSLGLGWEAELLMKRFPDFEGPEIVPLLSFLRQID